MPPSKKQMPGNPGFLDYFSGGQTYDTPMSPKGSRNEIPGIRFGYMAMQAILGKATWHCANAQANVLHPKLMGKGMSLLNEQTNT